MTALPPPSTTNAPTIVNPPALFDPTPFRYSQAVVAPMGCRIVFLSGQGGTDATGSLSTDFDAQVRQAYANLRALLHGIGATPAQVLKLTVFVVDHDQAKLAVLTSRVGELFGSTLPTQTLVPVLRLALDAMLFEVEAVVALGGENVGRGA